MGPKIQRVRLNNFWASGSILTGLFSVDAPRSRGDKMGTIFTMPAPKNLWRPKKSSKIFRDFLTTFDFDREYLRNGSTYQKSEKLLIICNPSHVRCKKLGVLWSTNVRVISSNKLHPNGLFSGDYISALRGRCAMKFLYALEIDQGYLAHTLTGTGVATPQKKFNRENYNTHTQKFVMAKKSSKIFRDFWQLSTFIANISGTDQNIKNRKSSWSSTTPPTLDEKNLAYFGPQT